MLVKLNKMFLHLMEKTAMYKFIVEVYTRAQIIPNMLHN